MSWNSFPCPICFRVVDPNSELIDQTYHNKGEDFEFECPKCESTYKVSVDWEPYYFIHKDTIKLKEEKNES